MSSSGVSSTARKREGWNFKCALTFRYNQAPPAIAYIYCYKIVLWLFWISELPLYNVLQLFCGLTKWPNISKHTQYEKNTSRVP